MEYPVNCTHGMRMKFTKGRLLLHHRSNEISNKFDDSRMCCQCQVPLSRSLQHLSSRCHDAGCQNTLTSALRVVRRRFIAVLARLTDDGTVNAQSTLQAWTTCTNQPAYQTTFSYVYSACISEHNSYSLFAGQVH